MHSLQHILNFILNCLRCLFEFCFPSRQRLSLQSVRLFQSKMSSESGQGLIEYLIIVCLVCVTSIAIMRVLGQNITAKFAQVSNSIQGKSANSGGVQMDEVKDTHFKKKDLSNFFQGAAAREEKND